MRTQPTIGICGAGIGGLSAAIASKRMGLHAEIFEQTSVFGRVGADINLTPNAVRALDGLGVGDELWLKAGGNADWVYGYDAWSAPIGLFGRATMAQDTY